MRTRARVLAAALLAAALAPAAVVPARAGTVLSGLFSAPPAPKTITKDFPAAGIKTVSAQVAIGDISLHGVSGSTITAQVSNDEPSECDVTMEVVGSELRIEARGTNRWFWQADRCRAKISAGVPSGTAVLASAGEGDVRASGLAGGANIHVGSGNILLKNVSGALRIHDGNGLVSGSANSAQVDAEVGNGSVNLDGLTGSAEAKTGNGNVRLAWAKAPKMGSAAVKTGHGDEVLEFPQGAEIQTSLVSGLGRVANEIGDAAGAPFSVSAATGLGNIIIKKK